MTRHYTPQQQESIRQRAAALGPDAIRQAEQDWQNLTVEVQKEMDAGTDPADPRVRALAARSKALLSAFTGGDPAIAASLGKMWQQETSIHGIDTAPMRAMMAYLAKAGA